jgi:hypothetical protein
MEDHARTRMAEAMEETIQHFDVAVDHELWVTGVLAHTLSGEVHHDLWPPI